MDKTVYILGAGFSKQAGFPITKEFTSKDTIQELKKQLSWKEKQRLKRISHYFLDRIKYRYCEDNIESVLNHVSVADYLAIDSQTEPGVGYSSQKIFNDLLWYIGKVLEVSSTHEIKEQYCTFLKKAVRQKATLISFNYDLVVETILSKLDYDWDYGLLEGKPKNLLLLKIHGSVNWAYCNDCKKVIFFASYEAPKIISSQARCTRCGKKNLELVLIPPILYKDAFYKNSKYEKLIRNLWKISHRELSEAKRIVFLGFSMSETDAYARELFKLSSNVNRTRGLSYMVLTKLKTKRKVKRTMDNYNSILIGEKIDFRQGTFLDYVDGKV